MIKAPIFICDDGDVSVFMSVVEAEQYLEPIEVLDLEMTIYDCEGTVLLATTHPLTTKNVEAVKISKGSKIDQEDLRFQILHFFEITKKQIDQSLSLPELIGIFIHEFGYTR